MKEPITSYLGLVRFEHPAQEITFNEYRKAAKEANKRVERITREDERPEKDGSKREREEQAATTFEQDGPDGDERPHIDIRV